MVADLLIAKNPDASLSLPYLIRIPLGERGLVLKTRDTWPRTSKLYCHRADGWPADAEIVERVAVRSCSRRGPAIDLVLDRARENRSQIVLTRARGREMIFWQSPRTAKQARPNVALPTRRAAGQILEILVDSREKYPYTFSHQQASTQRRALPAGDYAVELDGEVSAAVERKSLADLAGSLTTGKLTYALAELAALPRAAVVVEDRYSALFKLEHVSAGAVADALAEAQARFPAVPVVFTETRPLAQEWTYRFLGAALRELRAHAAPAAAEVFAPQDDVPGVGAVVAPAARVTHTTKPRGDGETAAVRAWAQAQGYTVADRGRIAADVVRAYRERRG
ncbi:ERCC4 domain-containing protein [Georgenia yuyongxinii]|uniref:ERCC4 domain-containing protein n=1 Tax=Georgenia yuyongxinii TaxID=2589797 RepID=UPI00163D5C0B|nr:histone-like nucleoid-structuring protein Lsr2 [Georgenia yuyongxinii]